MGIGKPQTALEALAGRRLLASSWPWRCAGYLLTTVPVAVPAFAVLGIPWLVLLSQSLAGRPPVGTIVLLVLLGSGLIGVLGPLIAPPLAKVERRRLRMVDDRPAALGRPAVTAPLGSGRTGSGRSGLVLRLARHYTDPATWREVGYACLLGTVAPVLSLAALLALPLACAFIASPFLVLAQQPGGAPVALGFGTAATVGQAVPYVVVGVLLLPLVPYLLTLLAGGHAAVARALLSGGTDQLRAELVEVSRSRVRLADAFEAERRRIERDLHDGAQQKLVSLTLQLGLARLDLPSDSSAVQSVTAAHTQAKQLMAELRQLIHGIHPQILTDLGLPAALEELAHQCPIPVTVETQLPGRLSSQTENAAYFVAAEALTNIAKHSGATNAAITARQHDQTLTVEIRDNGHGRADPRRGSGLTGLADRVAVTGGRMLLSSPAGGPTLLRVELPCNQ
jgi:signal transduction histidine kinase